MEKRLEIDYLLLGTVLLVCILSVLTLYGLDSSGTRWWKQLLFVMMSLGLMYYFATVNYLELGKKTLPIYGVMLALLLITLIPQVGTEVKGAQSWLRIGGFGFQPSAFANLAAILALAKYLRVQGMDTDKMRSLFISFALVACPMLLIIAQPDLGGAIFYVAILLLLLFLAGGNLTHIVAILIYASVVVLVPLYIGYFRITLIQPLIEQLADLGNSDLVRLVEIVGTEVWQLVDVDVDLDNQGAGTPVIYAGNHSAATVSFVNTTLGNPELMSLLKEISRVVRLENGGYLLLLAENSRLLIYTGVIASVVAGLLGLLFFFRGFLGISMRGNTSLWMKKVFIIVAIGASSLISAGTIPSVIKVKLHQVARITAFINPDKFSQDLAYQIRASKVAIGSGEVIGRGFASASMTVGKRPLVPEAETDFIFSAWSERTGFLGSLFLLICYAFILARTFMISMQASDRFGTLLGAGIGCMFLYHIFMNIGIALGLLPVTGLPLSFFSYGGSHMASSFIALGVLFSIYSRRHAN